VNGDGCDRLAGDHRKFFVQLMGLIVDLGDETTGLALKRFWNEALCSAIASVLPRRVSSNRAASSAE